MKWDKRLIIIISIAVLLIAVIVVWKSVTPIFTFDSLSDEDVINTFKVNKNAFVESKDYLINNNIDEIRQDSLDHQQICFVQLLEKLKYRGIHKVDNNYIYFVRISEFGFNKGIIYSISGNKPTSPYITQLTKIEEGWYIYKSK